MLRFCPRGQENNTFFKCFSWTTCPGSSASWSQRCTWRTSRRWVLERSCLPPTTARRLTTWCRRRLLFSPGPKRGGVHSSGSAPRSQQRPARLWGQTARQLLEAQEEAWLRRQRTAGVPCGTSQVGDRAVFQPLLLWGQGYAILHTLYLVGN